jgi:hypothetical protein
MMVSCAFCVSAPADAFKLKTARTFDQDGFFFKIKRFKLAAPMLGVSAKKCCSGKSKTGLIIHKGRHLHQ